MEDAVRRIIADSTASANALNKRNRAAQSGSRHEKKESDPFAGSWLMLAVLVHAMMSMGAVLSLNELGAVVRGMRAEIRKDLGLLVDIEPLPEKPSKEEPEPELPKPVEPE